MTQQRPLTDRQLSILMGSLNPQRISKRSQGGANLSYLEAWDVKATLIRIFGFGGFSADVIQSEVLYKDHVEKQGKNGTYKQWKVSVQSTVCLKIHQLGVSFTESAVGDGNMNDISEALDKALKTASSDALKRCAIYLGTQFGLSLYDKGSHNEVIRLIAAPGQEFWSGQIQRQQQVKDVEPDLREAEGSPGQQVDEAPVQQQVEAGFPQQVNDAEAAERVANALNAQPIQQGQQ